MTTGRTTTRTPRAHARLAAAAAILLSLAAAQPAAASADKEFTAPFGEFGTREQEDDCRPVYRTWGDCDATGAADGATGEIRATATLRRGVQHTGGWLRAAGFANMGTIYRLTRPARAIQMEAVVEMRALGASWWQRDPVNTTAPGYEGETRSLAGVWTSMDSAGSCPTCRHEQASQVLDVGESDVSAGPLTGTHRLTARLAAPPRELLAPGDYSVGIFAGAFTTSRATPVGPLLSTLEKDTGSFDAESSVRLVKLVVSTS